MTQDINNPKHYIADEGMVFQRISNGFAELEKPMTVGSQLYLGKILIDANGNALDEPIDDSIEFYTEIARPERKHREPETPEYIEPTEENPENIQEIIENPEENA